MKPEPAIRLFERIYPLLKRKHHNVLAWLVVVTGCAISSGPVWEPYVRAAMLKYADLAPPETPNPWAGMALIVVGLVYHFFTIRLDKLIDATRGESMRDHDAALYAELKKVFDDDWFYSFLGTIESDHSYYECGRMRLASGLNILLAPNRRFLFPDLQKCAQDLASALYAIQQFLAYKFFVWPEFQRGDNTRYCMQPLQCLDRGGDGSREQIQFYDDLVSELEELVKRGRAAYESFVATTHSRLGKLAL